MLYLIHKNGDGEPVGIWNQKSENIYRDDALKARGEFIVNSRAPHTSWASHLDKISRYANPLSWWEGVESNRSMQSVLNDAYRDYVSEEMGR